MDLEELQDVKEKHDPDDDLIDLAGSFSSEVRCGN